MNRPDVKISVVTVAYNSASTISDTIRSVLDQTYPPYEYIVIDGASKDDTVAVVNGFKDEFDDKGIALTVVSEKDNGMYDAMNKGVSKATGDIVGIINGYDWYEKDVWIAAVVQRASALCFGEGTGLAQGQDARCSGTPDRRYDQ